MVRTIVATMIALVSLVVLAYFCISRHLAPIETDLRTRVTDALATGGHTFAKIESIDGRDITLSGEAPTAAAKMQALAAVDQVWGARVAIDKMTVAPARVAPEPPHLFQAWFRDGVLTLTGAVPSETIRTMVIARARDQFRGATITDQLVVRERPPSTAWPEVLDRGMTQLARFTDGDLKLEGLAVTLSGTIKSKADYDLADAEMQRMPAEFSASFNAKVAPPTPSPPTEVAPVVAEPPPARLEKAAQNCQREFDNAFRGQTINFSAGSAAIGRQSQPLLKRLAAIAGKCPKARFTIAGHTDNSGAPNANLALSQARAQAVRNSMAKLGVAQSRMTARGYGQSRPVASNKTERGRAQNRRIVFIVR